MASTPRHPKYKPSLPTIPEEPEPAEMVDSSAYLGKSLTFTAIGPAPTSSEETITLYSLNHYQHRIARALWAVTKASYPHWFIVDVYGLPEREVSMQEIYRMVRKESCLARRGGFVRLRVKDLGKSAKKAREDMEKGVYGGEEKDKKGCKKFWGRVLDFWTLAFAHPHRIY